jgi:hypothetical protein
MQGGFLTMPSKFKRIILSLFVPVILLGIIACPGFIIEHIQIDFGPSGAVVGASGIFSCLSPVTGNVISIEWDFGDGSTASGQSASHTFFELGTFLVECRIVTPEIVLIFTKQIEISFPGIKFDRLDEHATNGTSLNCNGAGAGGGGGAGAGGGPPPGLPIPNLSVVTFAFGGSGGGTAGFSVEDGLYQIDVTGQCDMVTAMIIWSDGTNSNLVDLSAFSKIHIIVSELQGGPVIDCLIQIVDDTFSPGVTSDPFPLNLGLNSVSIGSGINMNAMNRIMFRDCNFTDDTSLKIAAFSIE